MKNEDTLILADQKSWQAQLCRPRVPVKKIVGLKNVYVTLFLFSGDIPIDKELVQGALISTIFCKVDLLKNICFMFYRHHCSM